MIAFRFRLERVLEWRRKELELEEARFQQRVAAVSLLDRERAELEARGIRAELQVRNWTPLEGKDLAALAEFRLYTIRRERAIAIQRAEQQKALDVQRERMLAARRRVRLLERLRERRLAEWQDASERELAELAAESHLAGIARRSADPRF
ncbi:MAG: hypothetical protein C5B51_22195 [Terriglobia bacterium]|nr:MAG: hypothetical protein C5B51_22195 [Terriglobia bacterium]